MDINTRHNLIKRLNTSLPHGTPFDLETLGKLGISPQLAARYARSGWLDRLAVGMYAFKGDSLSLHTTILFLQSRVKGLHVAGKSALSLHGVRHNLAANEQTVLWGNTRFLLPKWFIARFPARYVYSHLFAWPDDSQLAEKSLVHPPVC